MWQGMVRLVQANRRGEANYVYAHHDETPLTSPTANGSHAEPVTA
jgi:hypothetical protein